jgi:hypothetical protein
MKAIMKEAITIGCLSFMAGGIFAIVLNKILPSTSKPTKHYPIEVLSHWSAKGLGGYPTMECDSIKGDTVYKDGLFIVNKNIVNTQFK